MDKKNNKASSSPKEPKAIEAHLIKELPTYPSNIVTRAAEHFGVSRQTVHKHLKRLVAAGTVTQTGHTKAIHYFLSSEKEARFEIKLRPGLAEHEIWKEHLELLCADFPENVRRILEYGFTEMVNNVIDHSEGTRLRVSLKVEEGTIGIYISDDGVGIFKKIQKALQLPDLRESILHLSKGKFTTDASRHSGEGIFFTTRAFDGLSLFANGLHYMRTTDDWLITSKVAEKGTTVLLEIAVDSLRILENVFRQYTDVETHHFNQTRVVVELGKSPDERYISRSQAKRIVLGLEKFKIVVLDFERVEAVGQGFVDEVFRVFQNAHPDIKIEYERANADVEFMIKRSLS